MIISNKIELKNSEQILISLESILNNYNFFLDNINNHKIRKSLKNINFEERNSNKDYVKLKERAKQLNRDLIRIFENIDLDLMKRYLIV